MVLKTMNCKHQLLWNRSKWLWLILLTSHRFQSFSWISFQIKAEGYPRDLIWQHSDKLI